MGRYERQTKTGRLMNDRSKIRDEARLDGKYLITTSDDTLTPEDLSLGYKNLLEAERGFRDLKGTLLMRPVFHRKQDRIRAHVLVCFLALVIIRVAEIRAGDTWRTIGDELGRIKPRATTIRRHPPSPSQAAVGARRTSAQTPENPRHTRVFRFYTYLPTSEVGCSVSWPSVHAAALSTLAVSVTGHSSRERRRRCVAVVTSAGLLLCYLSLLVTRAHRPTDLLAGCLVTRFRRLCLRYWVGDGDVCGPERLCRVPSCEFIGPHHLLGDRGGGEGSCPLRSSAPEFRAQLWLGL